jgi:hypothetical protein
MRDSHLREEIVEQIKQNIDLINVKCLTNCLITPRFTDAKKMNLKQKRPTCQDNIIDLSRFGNGIGSKPGFHQHKTPISSASF